MIRFTDTGECGRCGSQIGKRDLTCPQCSTPDALVLHDLTWLLGQGYIVSARDPSLLSAIIDTRMGLRATDDAAYMVFDPHNDADGFLLTGDDLPTLLREARQHLET